MIPRPPPRRADRRTRLALVLAGAIVAAGSPALAQILGGGGLGLPGGLPSLPGAAGLRDLPARTAIPALPVPVEPLTQAAVNTLANARALAASRLIREHRDVIEADDRGQPVVRGEVLALGVGADALARLRRAGFGARSPDSLGGLGLASVVLTPPRGVSAIEAIRRLQALDPQGRYEFNHIYQPAGAALPLLAATTSAAGDGRGRKVGLIDGSAAQSPPSLSHTRLTQRAFAPGGAQVTAHATAVASLIAGDGGGLHGAAAGASLYVADVYGPTPAGGSAQAVAQGMAWLAQQGAPVINISLVGPPNLLLKAAVDALIARGHLVVAPVGNDGPAAPPLYPAAYAGVVAVTGVDPQGHVLPEAGRGSHVDFAAPASQMAAAGPQGGLVAVRGTSFASPIVAGQLALRMTAPDGAQAQAALDELGRAARRGDPADPMLGRGIVGAELRTPPRR